jgi:hypothetical protein
VPSQLVRLGKVWWWAQGWAQRWDATLPSLRAAQTEPLAGADLPLKEMTMIQRFQLAAVRWLHRALLLLLRPDHLRIPCSRLVDIPLPLSSLKSHSALCGNRGAGHRQVAVGSPKHGRILLRSSPEAKLERGSVVRLAARSQRLCFPPFAQIAKRSTQGWQWRQSQRQRRATRFQSHQARFRSLFLCR